VNEPYEEIFIAGYYLKIECPTCEKDIFNGTRCIGGMETRNGLPVIAVDFAISQITFDCDNCGCQVGTGDWEQIADVFEEGEDPDDLDEEDENDDDDANKP